MDARMTALLELLTVLAVGVVMVWWTGRDW